jgi:hypothetical protein
MYHCDISVPVALVNAINIQLDMENIVSETRKELIKWYRAQLEKFHKIGLGKFTEHNTLITKKLINATEARIVQLGGPLALAPNWGKIREPLKKSKNPSTARVKAFRKRQKLKELNNGQLPSNNGSTTTKTCKMDSHSRNGKGRS